MKNRLGLIFLGDRHTPVGRGVRVWRQRRRSSADDASHIVVQRNRSAPTTSASPTSPSDAATAEATAAMTDYFAVLDELRSAIRRATSRS